MILSHDAILTEIGSGNISIDPYEEAAVGPASIDLRLGGELRVLETGGQAIDISDDIDVRDHSRVVALDGGYELAPGETVLGMTHEHVRLAANISARLEGRSRFARVGLLVHVSAGFVSPGVVSPGGADRQVDEVSNLAARPLRLLAGTRICQMIFERTEGSALYRGRFADQDEL